MDQLGQRTETAFEEVLKRYGLSTRQVIETGNYDHFVSEVERDGSTGILRISRRPYQTFEAVMGEVLFIRHLVAAGVPCARPLPSLSGNYVERIRGEDRAYPVVLFDKAEGRHPELQDLTQQLFETLGETVAILHEYSRTFVPSRPEWRRHDWAMDCGRVEAWFPSHERLARQVYRDTVEAIRAIPVPTDAYGLVHGDAHGGNFFVHHGGITLFDFADCHYSWYAFDLAMSLFYLVMAAPDGSSREDYAATVLAALLRGYRRHRAMDARQLSYLPIFLKLRELDLYAQIVHDAGDYFHRDPWNARDMAGRKERIEGGVPYLELDFSRF